VIVVCLVKGTLAAVKTPPAGVMVPLPLAVQLTTELKLPVPDTVDVHWVVCPAATVVGLQLAPTTVMAEVVLPLLPPQATSNKRQHTAARIPKSRTPAPLLDIGNIHTLWNHRRYIRAAVETACVAVRLKHEAGGLNRYRRVSAVLLGDGRLLHRLEI